MKKIYSLSGITLAAFIGGPLAFGYLMYRNYLAFGQNIKARNTALLATGFTVLLFFFLLFLSEKWPMKILNILLPIILMSVGSLLVKHYQEAEIIRHLDERIGEKRSDWHAAGVSILWCFATLALGFIYVLLIKF